MSGAVVETLSTAETPKQISLHICTHGWIFYILMKY